MCATCPRAVTPHLCLVCPSTQHAALSAHRRRRRSEQIMKQPERRHWESGARESIQLVHAARFAALILRSARPDRKQTTRTNVARRQHALHADRQTCVRGRDARRAQQRHSATSSDASTIDWHYVETCAIEHDAHEKFSPNIFPSYCKRAACSPAGQYVPTRRGWPRTVRRASDMTCA